MARRLIWLAGCAAAVQLAIAVVAFTTARGVSHAVLGMGIGLYVFWIILGGLLTWRFREPVRRLMQRITIAWPVKFILLATALAMLEEVVTVAMTNTARFYGVSMDQAHVTASANYWDVVLTSSVVLFVPMFCIWAWLLSRYSFSAEAVFLLWGVTGALMETLYGGPQHLLEAGMWTFVYGLMIFLPAYAIPAERSARPPRWWAYLAAPAVTLLGVVPGGILATIFRHLRPPHVFPGIH
jgi:hypothetical protein